MGEEGLYIAKKVPVLTTTQRDLLIAVEGLLIFNSTTDQLEEYDGATWQAVGQVILTTHEADTITHGTVDDIADQADIATHTADPDAHQFIPKQKAAVSLVSPFICYEAPTTTDIIAGYLYATPFWLPRAATLDLIGFYLAANGAAGAAVRLGIYDDTDWYPNALKVDAGTINATTGAPSVKTIAINLTLAAGVYWLVFLANDSTIDSAYFDHVLQYRMISPSQGYRKAQTYGALPSTFPAGGAGNYVWYMSYEVASWG